MENYKRFMHERFERNLSPVQRDTLRALKLLSRAGILPITHRQVAAVLEAGRLFDWRDVHLQRDCLNGLRDNSFLRLAPDREVVQPEPAYLADDVVPYTEGKEPEQDFDALMQILEHIEDATGLFFLGNTYVVNPQDFRKAIEAYDAALQIRPDYAEALYNKGSSLSSLERYGEAVEAYDAALRIRPDYAQALNNKGIVLSSLERYGEAVEAYDAALRIRPDYAQALYNKGVTLLVQERKEEALDHLCKSWERRERLPDGGASLANLFAYLGRKPGECR
jgi:tetratricopeptide (TPR) repeat protein